MLRIAARNPPAIRDLLINVFIIQHVFIRGDIIHVLYAIHHHHEYNNLFLKNTPFFFPVAFELNSPGQLPRWLKTPPISTHGMFIFSEFRLEIREQRHCFLSMFRKNFRTCNQTLY